MRLVKAVTVLLVGSIFALSIPTSSLANTNECGYSPKKGVNPTFQETSCLLTTVALEYGVPPEIVKAVATQENAEWRQFKENGEPFISTDNGIGIMQITTYEPEDEEKLKNNVIFNIEAGVKRLVFNFNNNALPKINDHSPEKLESWYFAVMAYNGIKPVNSPIVKETGKRNAKAYQEEVFARLGSLEFGVLNTKVLDLPFEVDDFNYDPSSTKNIEFTKLQYDVDGELTSSREMSTINDYIRATTNTHLRNGASRENKAIKDITKGSVLAITGDLVADQKNTYNKYSWYKAEDSEDSGYVASPNFEKIGARLGGAHRYATAVEISKRGWESADAVVLATGENFPDALAGGPLAKALNAPILLTESTKLSWATEAEIKRLKAKEVVILGSSSAVSQGIESKLRAMGIKVERIAGGHRYETSVKIAEKLVELNGTSEKVILAYGENFPDALAVAPYAANKGYPILLTKTNEIPSVVKAALKGKEQTIVVGGKSVISDSVTNHLSNPLRIAGSGRFETAVKIMNTFDMNTEKIFFANSNSYADALTGSVLAANYGAPLLLVYEKTMPANVYSEVSKQPLDQFYLLGSDDVINESLVQGTSYSLANLIN